MDIHNKMQMWQQWHAKIKGLCCDLRANGWRRDFILSGGYIEIVGFLKSECISQACNDN